MGLLDFLKDKGEDLFGGNRGNEASQIKDRIERDLGNNIENLGVMFDDNSDTVTLQGTAKSQAAKERAVLIAGNVRGVANVNDDRLTVSAAQAAAASTGSSTYYTIQSGDTLSEIAKRHYGDASAYNRIVEANQGVISDPDKIYPGQKIRIPA